MSSMTSLSLPAIKISSGVPIYAPQNVEVLVGKSPETVLGVEHDDDAVYIVGKTFVDPASRRDFEGFSVAIERGFMFGCPSLGSGDPGDYLIVDVRVTVGDRLDDADSAVIKPRIAQYEESAASAIVHTFADQAFEYGLLVAIEVDNGRAVGGAAVFPLRLQASTKR